MFFSLNSGAAGDAETAALHFANMAGVAVTGFVLCGIALVLLGHSKNAAVLWTAQVLGALRFMIALAVEMIYLMSVPLLLDGEVTANGQMNWQMNWQAPCLNVSLMICDARSLPIGQYKY